MNQTLPTSTVGCFHIDVEQPGAAAATRSAEMVFEGDYWTVTFDGHQIRVRDSKGMRYLAELLSRPGTDLPATLLAGVRSGRRGPQSIDHAELGSDDGSGAAPILDTRAKLAYRGRLAELRQEREEADAFHDPERAARARAEYDFVVRELASAVGLGGRDRRSGSAAERARLNVTRAIRTSIASLAKHDPQLGDYLCETVLTGRICVYRPNRGHPGVQWRIVGRPKRKLPRFSAPETRYVEVSGVNIAYQVFGDGPIDLLFLPSWISHLDLQWSDPTFARLLRNLGDFARVITFDKRGVGLSDPVYRAPTVEERLNDIRRVLEAAQSSGTVLFGLYDGAAMLAQFAATFPERVQALVLYGVVPAGPGAASYPGQDTFATLWHRMRAAVDTEWGHGASLSVLAPEFADNKVMRRMWAIFERAAMSPTVARSALRWLQDLDIRSVLATIQAPTLVLHCTGDVVPMASGRYVADQIPQAEFVALPGDWHAPLTGDMDLLVDPIRDFVTTLPRTREPARILATVLAMQADAQSAETAYEQVVQAGGVVVAHTTDRVVARFDGPAKAARAALGIIDQHAHRLRAGLHAGECELLTDQLAGIPVVIAEELAARASPGEILVTSTIRDLVLGSGLEFAHRGVGPIRGAPGDWQIHTLLRDTHPPTLAAATSDPVPLLDRAARTAARYAPGMNRAVLRAVKGSR